MYPPLTSRPLVPQLLVDGGTIFNSMYMRVQNIVNRNVLNLYYRIFKIENPARSLMPFFLTRYITYGTTVPGMLSCYKLLYAFIFVSYFILNYSRCTIW